MKSIIIKTFFLTVILFLRVMVIYSQRVEFKKYETFTSFFNFSQNESLNLYGASMKFSSQYPIKQMENVVPNIVKFDENRNFEKEIEINIPGYNNFLPDRGLSSSWPFINWNKNEKTLDVIISLINNLQSINDTAKFSLILAKYDENLNYLSHKVIDENASQSIVLAEFFNDSLLFTTLNDYSDGFAYMGKYNLNSGKKTVLKDLRNSPGYYHIKSFKIIDENKAYFTIGFDLYVVNFKTNLVTEINPNYGGYPNIITPKSKHGLLQDSSIVIIGTNEDSVMLGETTRQNVSYNVYALNGTKLMHKIIPIKEKYHEIGTYENVAFTNNACYIFSNSYDSTNVLDFDYINFFSTPAKLEVIKTDLHGNLLWRKPIETKTGSGISRSISSINSNIIVVYAEWNYIEHPNEFVKDLVFVFMNTDGEVLSTQTIATENIADFLVYPNPVAQGEPLTLQLNENFNGQQQIHITSLNGALVQQQQVVVANGKTQIDVNQLAAGQYLISVNGNQNTTVPLVVK